MKNRLATLGSVWLLLIPAFSAPVSASADSDSVTALATVAGLAVDPNHAHPAIPIVESLHDSFVEIMKTAEELGYQRRTAALKPVLENSFDLEFMAKKSIGRSWKTLNEEEQARWLETFERLTCASYAGRFDGHSGQRFETGEIRPASHDTMMVQTTLLNPAGDDVELNYRLVETKKGWRIIDVYLDGTVSELALRRAEYSAVLKREGFQKLIADVDRRVAELGTVQ